MSKKQKTTSTERLDYQPEFKIAFLSPGHWPTWAGVFVLWLLMFTPAAFRGGVASVITALTYKPGSKRYRIAKKNLVLCFPEKEESELDKMLKKFFYYKARIFLDYAFLWFANEKRLSNLYRVKNDDELRALKKENKNIILLTCHMLALDHGALALSFDNKMVSMVKALKNPVINWLVVRGRIRFNMHIYERAYGMMGVVSDTKKGDQFVYLPDEDLAGRHSEFVPFFGVQKATITALGRLAKICDAKVLPYIPVFNDKTGSYEMHFLPSMKDYPTGDELVDALAMNQVLEKLVLIAPDQYLWTFLYFKTRPGDEPSVY